MEVMHDDALTWLPHGFFVELDQPEDETTPLKSVLALYAMCVPTVLAAAADAAFLPLLGSLLLPLPTALVWSVLRPRRIRIDVDHQRIRVQGPFGGRRTVELRWVREVEVRADGLDLVLRDGGRVAVHAPTSHHRLGRLAHAIAQLRDEVSGFEAELRGTATDIVQVSRLARRARAQTADR
jgi:hypothetical protein